MVKRLLARTASERRDAADRNAPDRTMRLMAFSALVSVLEYAAFVVEVCDGRIEGRHDGHYFYEYQRGTYTVVFRNMAGSTESAFLLDDNIS